MVIHLLLEGRLEEFVAEKLLIHCGHQKGDVYGLQGCNYIRNKAALFHRLATENEGVLVLTDFMDSRSLCPVHALNTYLLQHITNPSRTFLCRFAVPELESWLIADRKSLAGFLKIPIQNIPTNPDELKDPKQKLVNLARKSKKTCIRESIVPEESHCGVVGQDYLLTMRNFVSNHWEITDAIKNSPSLARCIYRLKQLNS